MMTPRERVLAALAHRQPDRVPFSWGFGPTEEMTRTLVNYLTPRGMDWEKLRRAVEDVRYVGPRYIGPAVPANYDLWGIEWKVMQYQAGEYREISRYPLAGIEDSGELDDYPWPSADDYAYDTLRAETLAGDPERLRATKLPAGNPFEIYCWMTGLEEALMNLLANPEVVTAAMERISGFFAAKLRRALAEIGDLVDIIFLADDLGGQQGLLISRENYRALVQPFHRRLVKAVREYSAEAKIMLHSDGSVFEILPDLIDAGIQIMEAVQTDAAMMEPERLKSNFGDRLSFHGAISVQSLLPHGMPETVDAECRRLVSVLGANGGYIAAPSHAIQVGTPPANVLAMLRAVLGEASYQNAIQCAMCAQCI